MVLMYTLIQFTMLDIDFNIYVGACMMLVVLITGQYNIPQPRDNMLMDMREKIDNYL